MISIEATIDYNLKEGVTLEQVLSLLEQGHPNPEYIAKAIQQSIDEGYVDNISLLSDDVDAWLYIDDGDVSIGLHGNFSNGQAKWINDTLLGGFIEQTASKPFTYEMTYDLEEMSVDVLPHFETYGDLTKMLDDQEIEKAKENILASIQFLQQAAINRNVGYRELVGHDFADKAGREALGNTRSTMIFVADDVKSQAPDLNDNRANWLLDFVCKHHDSDFGISWQTLKIAADDHMICRDESAVFSFENNEGEKQNLNGFVNRRDGEINCSDIEEAQNITVRLKGSIIEIACESTSTVSNSVNDLIKWTDKLEEEKLMTLDQRLDIAIEHGYQDVIESIYQDARSKAEQAHENPGFLGEKEKDSLVNVWNKAEQALNQSLQPSL